MNDDPKETAMTYEDRSHPAGLLVLGVGLGAVLIVVILFLVTPARPSQDCLDLTVAASSALTDANVAIHNGDVDTANGDIAEYDRLKPLVADACP